jgi:hypothetical protein
MANKVRQEELYEARLNQARRIKPGWVPIPLSKMSPKRYKPRMEHLEQVARERGLKQKFKIAQEYVDWLSRNGPTDEGECPDVVRLITVNEDGQYKTELFPSPKKAVEDGDGYDSSTALGGPEYRASCATPKVSATAKTCGSASSSQVPSSSSSSSSKNAVTGIKHKSKKWSWPKDLARLMWIIVKNIKAFLERDKTLRRGQKDRGDVKPFWNAAAVQFNDEGFTTVVEEDPDGRLEKGTYSAEYSGLVTDSCALE